MQSRTVQSKRAQEVAFPERREKAAKMNVLFGGRGLLDFFFFFNSNIMTPSTFMCHYFCENLNYLLCVQVCNIKRTIEQSSLMLNFSADAVCGQVIPHD